MEQQVIDHIENEPTEEESRTLRRVPGSLPTIAYLICTVEFAERASYYGVQPLITNFVNRKFPADGDGLGAPPPGTQETAGALNMGLASANAVSQSFSMLVYVLPVLFGWIADKYTGRFKIICWGVAVCGVAHALMVGAGAPSLLHAGTAVAPYLLSIYILAVGAGK
jgi:dipeptide/tripeptide permease